MDDFKNIACLTFTRAQLGQLSNICNQDGRSFIEELIETQMTLYCDQIVVSPDRMSELWDKIHELFKVEIIHPKWFNYHLCSISKRLSTNYPVYCQIYQHIDPLLDSWRLAKIVGECYVRDDEFEVDYSVQSLDGTGNSTSGYRIRPINIPFYNISKAYHEATGGVLFSHKDFKTRI